MRVKGEKMNGIRSGAFIFLGVFIVPFLVFAEEVAKVVEPEQAQDALGFLPAIVEAFKSGHYLMAGALISLVVTFVLRSYVLPRLKLNDGLLPILSAAIGLLSGVGLAVANGATLNEATLAVFSGPLASMLWSSSIKYFFKKPV